MKKGFLKIIISIVLVLIAAGSVVCMALHLRGEESETKIESVEKDTEKNDYTEVVFEGAKPAGTIFRFYKNVSKTNDVSVFMVLKGEFTLYDKDGLEVSFSLLYFGYEIGASKTLCIGNEPIAGSCGEIKNSTIDIDETDEYIDVVLKVGDTIDINFNKDSSTENPITGKITITADTTINSFHLGTVYYLVP